MVMLMNPDVSAFVKLPVLRPVWSGPAVLGPGVPRSTYGTGQNPPCAAGAGVVVGAGVAGASAAVSASVAVFSDALAVTSADVSTGDGSVVSVVTAWPIAVTVTPIWATAALMSSCAAMIFSWFSMILSSLTFSLS